VGEGEERGARLGIHCHHEKGEVVQLAMHADLPPVGCPNYLGSFPLVRREQLWSALFRGELLHVPYPTFSHRCETDPRYQVMKIFFLPGLNLIVIDARGASGVSLPMLSHFP